MTPLAPNRLDVAKNVGRAGRRGSASIDHAMKMSRLLRLFAVVVVTGMILAGTLPAHAQTESGVADALVPASFRSPRATMMTFLEVFATSERPDLATATACLELSELSPKVQALKGGELAVKLKNIIDRTRYVELDTIPADPQGRRWLFASYDHGSIVLTRQLDGRWLFSAATVAAIDDIRREVAGREVVAGVEDVSQPVTPAMWMRRLMPSSLRSRVFLLESWQWLGIMAVILIGVIVGRLFSFIAGLSLDRILRQQFQRVDADLLAKAIQPAGVFVMVVLWGLGVAWMGLPISVLRVYVDAVVVAGVVAFVVVAYRLADVVCAVLEARALATASRFDDLLVPLVRKSLKVFVVAVGAVMVAQNLGTDVTGLVAGLGLGGLAFALAAKDTVGNLFGSVTVLIDRPFQVGDWVKIGDVEGTVEELGFRSTRIRTFYNSLITLPNSNLIMAAVDNLGARTYRRWSTRLGITYDTPPAVIDAFCEGIRELVRHHPYTRKDYYHVYFNEFGGACLEILVYVFFRTPDWATELRERHRLGVDILRLAHDLGVEFAFPTQTVYLRREEWSAPAPGETGYRTDSERLSDRARAAAVNLVAGSRGDELPGPVRFSSAEHEDGGDSPVSADA